MKPSDEYMKKQRKKLRGKRQKRQIGSSTPPGQRVVASQQQEPEALAQEVAEAPREKLSKNRFIQAVQSDLTEWTRWTDAEKQSLEKRGIETQNDSNQQKTRFFNKLTQALTLTPLDKIESLEFQQEIWRRLDEVKAEKTQPIQTLDDQKIELTAMDSDLKLSEKQTGLESYAKSFSQRQQTQEVASTPKEQQQEKKKTFLRKMASKIGKEARAAMKRPSRRPSVNRDPRRSQDTHNL